MLGNGIKVIKFRSGKMIFVRNTAVRYSEMKKILSPEATVITVWKMAVRNRGILKRPISHVLNFRAWI